MVKELDGGQKLDNGQKLQTVVKKDETVVRPGPGPSHRVRLPERWSVAPEVARGNPQTPLVFGSFSAEKLKNP